VTEPTPKPRLKHLTIKNYRNLYDVDLELQPLTVMIGKNGTGKSNFLNFFRMLKEAAEGNLRGYISVAGGFSINDDSVLSYWANPDDFFEWKLTFGGFKSDDSEIFYECQMTEKGQGYKLYLEAISRPPYGTHTDNFYYLNGTDGRLRILKAKQGASSTQDEYYDEVYDEQELLIHQIRSRALFPLLDEMRRELSDWVIFRGFGQGTLEYVRRPQSLEIYNPLRLEPSGKNLVSFLYTLQNEHPDHYERLLDVLQAAFPDFKQFTMPLVASGTPTLYWHTNQAQRFGLSAVSDGMLRFLGLAALLLTPDPPSLIAIDEPEIGLYFDVFPILGELMQDAAQRTQLIISTHSPALLNQMNLEQVLLMKQDDDGKTVIQPAATVDYIDRWLERYTLGNLWAMNKFDLG